MQHYIAIYGWNNTGYMQDSCILYIYRAHIEHKNVRHCMHILMLLNYRTCTYVKSKYVRPWPDLPGWFPQPWLFHIYI